MGYCIMSFEDKYLWLENLKDPRVSRWISRENKRLRSFLGDMARRLRGRIARYYRVPYALQVVASRKGFFTLFREADSYSVRLMYRDGEAAEIVNSKSLGKNIVLKWIYVERSGDVLAYTFSYAGEDLGITRIINVDSGEMLDEVRGFIRDITWVDKEAYYYVRFYRDERTPDGVKPPTDRVFIRRGGEDELVFGEGVPTGHFISLKSSRDSSKALLTISYGWTWSDVYGGDLRDPFSWKRVYGESRFISTPIDWIDGAYYILSHEDKRGLGIILKVPENSQAKRVIVRPKKFPVQGAVVAGDTLIVHFLENASSSIRIYRLKGGLLKKIPIRPPGAISSIDSLGDEAVFKYESFHIPYILFRVNSRGKVEELNSSGPVGDYPVKEEWVTSSDGTKIHVFKVGRGEKKVAIAYGYGGFGIAIAPMYIPHIIPFIRDGGLFVVANLRGGSEFGEEWHRAGMRENKQKVFEDFISVIKKLKVEGYKVVAMGSSNGGLLVGATLTQKPELLDGAVIGYPVLDMLRFHKLYIGAAWIAEYGNPEDPNDRRYLVRYSPYHNVRRTKYPPTLVYTGLHDDRVHPGHALKFVAKLREVGAPVLLRVEGKSGHSGATPNVKVREYADILAFIYKVTGLSQT